MAIQPHTNQTQTKWDHGDFAVMVMSPNTSKPIGFCDGTDEDEFEIIETATQEGAEVVIDKKHLKTGREIWTIRAIAQI